MVFIPLCRGACGIVALAAHGVQGGHRSAAATRRSNSLGEIRFSSRKAVAQRLRVGFLEPFDAGFLRAEDRPPVNLVRDRLPALAGAVILVAGLFDIVANDTRADRL